MSPFVFAAVLGAALLHAAWNAVAKVGLDGFAAILLIAMAGGVASFILLPFFPTPDPASWPYLAVSVALHQGYNLGLIAAYRTGDFGQVYPLARGGAPLMVTLAGLLVLGEPLDPGPLVGILVLVSGVWLMARRGGGTGLPDRRSVLAALLTSAFIAGYTVTDGLGGRLAGSPHGYALWLFALDGVCAAVIYLGVRGWAGIRALGPALPAGLGGGALSLGAYWTVIWAMTQAPMGMVAALRETSILFALLLSVLVLKERAGPWRLAAGGLIALGAVLLKTL
ncbi:EamA family transporter [Rhodospirillum sp. A1_3_36]|uniref:EamA family transporter n=1 Tax=Rhodospirillum sp. A1_3_36 TaxID=3391666 RepID=UPI0039A77C7D